MDILTLGAAKKFAQSGGSGLPDPADLPDGTALIKVGNEWKTQEGYGYGEDELIVEWDGNTEGRETLPEEFDMGYLYKVNDGSRPMPTTLRTVGVLNGTIHDAELEVAALDEDGIVWAATGIGMGYNVIVVVEDIEIEGIMLYKGTYFMKYDEPGAVAQINKAFLPSSSHPISSSLLPMDEIQTRSELSHETWTFTLDDDTTVTKEVVTWTGQA